MFNFSWNLRRAGKSGCHSSVAVNTLAKPHPSNSKASTPTIMLSSLIKLLSGPISIVIISLCPRQAMFWREHTRISVTNQYANPLRKSMQPVKNLETREFSCEVEPELCRTEVREVVLMRWMSPGVRYRVGTWPCMRHNVANHGSIESRVGSKNWWPPSKHPSGREGCSQKCSLTIPRTGKVHCAESHLILSASGTHAPNHLLYRLQFPCRKLLGLRHVPRDGWVLISLHFHILTFWLIVSVLGAWKGSYLWRSIWLSVPWKI